MELQPAASAVASSVVLRRQISQRAAWTHVFHQPSTSQRPAADDNTINENFYARKQNASRVFAIVWASVRLSVTLVICIKTVQARITKSSLWAAPSL